MSATTDNNGSGDPRWRPNATVATVIERDGLFLMVEEIDKVTGECVYNQPAGHLEPDESLVAAAVREVLEETGYHSEVTGYLGVSLFRGGNGVTYLRHSFVAKVLSFDATVTLDEGIIAAHWIGLSEIRENAERLRSPLTLRVIENYVDGHIAPLSLVNDFSVKTD